MLTILVNLTFALALMFYCEYVDGPVTKTLKEELKEKGVEWK